jgi:hypothetical protein
MNPIAEQIRNLLIDAPKGVHSIFYGKKITNGETTDEPAIVYHVDKKLPLNEIPANEIIPKSIDLNEEKYTTDVIQQLRFKTKQCYAVDDPSIQDLCSRHRPLSGGLMISCLQSWEQDAPTHYTLYTGTLGFVAVDNVDNTLVGVTNAHVIVTDATYGPERDSTGTVYSITDYVTFADYGTPRVYHSKILQWNLNIYPGVDFILDQVGLTKRYVPISLININTVDGALIALSANSINNSSAQQAQLANTYAMPFATTSEINSLISSSIPLYSVGKTTGAKGTSCPLITDSLFGSIRIHYPKQGIETEYIMSDVIIYKFLDNSNLPIWAGDSGSALIGRFSGVNKIVGLVFAGDNGGTEAAPTSTRGVACRIDNVASELNISAWDGSPHQFKSRTDVVKAYRPLTDTRLSFVYNGKTYFQAGLELTAQPFTNV